MSHAHISITNAAGWCKTTEDIHRMLDAPTTGVIIGGGTADENPRLGLEGEYREQHGKEGCFFYIDPITGDGVNARGLPHPGRRYYDVELPALQTKAAVTGRQIGFNFSATGAGAEEYAVGAELCRKHGLAVFDANVGCPNVWKNGTQKPILSYDPRGIEEVLRVIGQALAGSMVEVHLKLSPLVVLPDQPIEYRPGMKLPPIDRTLVNEIADVIRASGIVSAVVSCNTLPNVRMRNDSSKPVLDSPDGLGGLSGPIMKPLAIEQCRLLGEQLPAKIRRIGCSGIKNGRDIYDFVTKGGCSGVQVGTAWMNNPNWGKFFSDLQNEFVSCLADS